MRRLAACFALWLAVVAGAAAATPDPGRWFGFNLLEKFTLAGNAPYRETDFRWIAEWGFTFVRLPLDYRCYTEPGDWLAFRESALAEIDAAVAAGARHGLHVCLNLHRAPGYCINPPAEPRDLWSDAGAEAAFVAHWEMFARRYRDVPPERLSFNLLNEPARASGEAYLRVHRRAIEAIQAIDPRRPIVVDGNHTGREPAPALLVYPQVIQATRGYHPMSISHHRAPWVRDTASWPEPAWPPARLAGHLYGPGKRELHSPLVLAGDFPAGTAVSLAIAQVSQAATLVAAADGREVARAVFDPRREPAAWREIRTDGGWIQHRPAAPRAFAFTLPAAAREITVAAVAGDWLRFNAVDLRRPGRPGVATPAEQTWGERQHRHPVDDAGRVLAPPDLDPQSALAGPLRPWRDFAAAGGRVFVGEWGAYNRTPHAVTLAWMDDMLAQFRAAGLGWALWNFRGSFGVLDSNRPDVAYEDWHGHRLDRAMLDRLRRHAAPPGQPMP